MSDFHTQILPDPNDKGGNNTSTNPNNAPTPKSNWKKYLLVFLLVFGGIVGISAAFFRKPLIEVIRGGGNIGESAEKKKKREEEEQRKKAEEQKRKEQDQREKEKQIPNNDTNNDDEKRRIEEEKEERKKKKEEEESKRKTAEDSKKEEERKRREEEERERNAIDPTTIAINGNEAESREPGVTLPFSSTYDPSKRYKNNFKPSSLSWSIGDTNIGNGSSVSKRFDEPGAYTVNLIYDGGILSSKPVTIKTSSKIIDNLLSEYGQAVKSKSNDAVINAKAKLEKHINSNARLSVPANTRANFNSFMSHLTVSFASDPNYSASIQACEISNSNGKVSRLSIQ